MEKNCSLFIRGQVAQSFAFVLDLSSSKFLLIDLSCVFSANYQRCYVLFVILEAQLFILLLVITIHEQGFVSWSLKFLSFASFLYSLDFENYYLKRTYR